MSQLAAGPCVVRQTAVGEVFIWWIPSCCDSCCAPPRADAGYTRWKRPNRRSVGVRLLDFVCDGFGLVFLSNVSPMLLLRTALRLS